MADADDVRRVALALPHAVEIDSAGFAAGRPGGLPDGQAWPTRIAAV